MVLSKDVYGTLRMTEVDSTLKTIKNHSQFDLGLSIQQPRYPCHVSIQTRDLKVRQSQRDYIRKSVRVRDGYIYIYPALSLQ